MRLRETERTAEKQLNNDPALQRRNLDVGPDAARTYRIRDARLNGFVSVS